MDERIDLIEKFLSRAQPDWRDIARGKEPTRRALGGNEFVAALGEPHPDMVVDENQTRKDRIALGFDPPDGRDDDGNLIDDEAPESTDREEPGRAAPEAVVAERDALWAKLERFRGKDGFNVPASDATTDQLRAALTVAEEREKAQAAQ